VTPERWQIVKKVLAAALERTPKERRAYLDHACTDKSLRQEVESLIAAHEQGDSSFMEHPLMKGVGMLNGGMKLGPYEIVARLGAGGMGEVYRARDTRLNRIVAIKILPQHLADSPVSRERFEHEARMIASLNHSHICTLHDVGRQGGMDYLVMEYLEGETLALRLVKGGLPFEQTLQYAIEIADALDAAHSKGVTHRDVKPGNIMLTKSGAKLLDFGLAKLRREVSPAAAISQLPTTNESITAQGMIVGTLQYMAPEQLEGREVDARTDIFAFGAVVYEMATGKKAFAGSSEPSIIAKILKADPPPISSLQPMTPPTLDRVVKTCLAKEADKRWQTASDLCRELKTIAGSGSQTTLTQKQRKVIDSLAILPLENANGDPEADYLSDGIAERLINSLVQLRKIRVVPRTLAFRHRGPGVDALGAGRALGVRAVLTGRMVQRGEDLLVSVELVDVKQEAQLWGAQYNRKVADLVALQEELTTEISEKLRLQLTRAQQKRLRKRPTHSDEAYRLFLKAIYCNVNEWPLGARKVIAFCQQAIAIDPQFAAAYAWMSMAYINLSFFSLAPTAEVMPPGKAAARKALELDETLAEAHISLGYACLMDWDFVGAEREIQRGLELNPDSVPVYNYLMTMLWARGRFAEALTAAKRATELDPSSLTLNRNLGLSLYFVGSFDRAAEQFVKTLEIEPRDSLVHASLAEQYACAGHTEKAIEKCAEALALNPRVMFVRMSVAATYAKVGRTVEASKIVEEAEKAWKVGDGFSWWIAAVHALLGDKDAAFEWLERAFQERATFLVFLKFHPHFDPLHGDPRFDDLVKRIGIPD
jgi:serine/threonine protein kinase/Flp pilus assembly protein TadD